MLVVVAVIGILAALLLPALSGATQKAKRLQCISNLKQWALALQFYTDDAENNVTPREGHLPGGNVRPDNWANVQDRNNGSVWYNALPREIGSLSASNFASSASGARRRFYQDKLWHCPSAKFHRGVELDSQAYFSLSMNSKLILPPESVVAFSSMKQPSSTVSFLDSRVSPDEYKVDPSQPITDLGQPSSSASRFAARHTMQGNLAFCDGHVDSLPGKQVVETRPGYRRGYAILPQQQIVWTPDPADNPDAVGD